MIRLLLLLFLTHITLLAYQTTNIQLLHSNNFDGDAFIYDTKSEKKTTLTVEHYRTWDYGDLFMFADIMSGKRFDDSSSGIYGEISPRFSFSKILGSSMKLGIIEDVYIATQVNLGRNYEAYLYGLGLDFKVPLFNVLSINLYEKDENIYKDDSYQVTVVYITQEKFNFHLEGFIDITKRDVNTQNQLLYSIDEKKNFYIGLEWLYYKYNHQARQAKTNVIQGMIKYRF